MAERLTSIAMQAFRGVPDTFTVNLPNGCSYVALGDNGTGKSTVADAIEWYFRGEIELLTKEGRSDAVRHSGAVEGVETKVTISTDGSLGGAITTSKPSPQALRDIGRSELFLLRGRTLADFVDQTKGEKWQTLAKLLGLEAIDRMRLDLQRAKNELEGTAQSAGTDLAQRRSALGERVPEVSETTVLQAIVAKCEAAEVEPPGSLDDALDPQWLDAIVPAGSQVQRAAVLQAALADLRTNTEQSVPLDPIEAWNQFVEGAKQDDHLRLGLYQAAESLLKSGHAQPGQCPLCRQPVDLDALAHDVAGELEGLAEAAQALDTARQAAGQFVKALGDVHRSRLDVSRRAHEQSIELTELPESLNDELSRLIDSVSTMDRATSERYQGEMGVWDAKALEALEAAIPAPATPRDQALVEIGVLHTEASAWRSAVRDDHDASTAFALADRVFTRYQVRQHKHFTDAIKQISGRAAEIYEFLHPEGGITAVAVETVGDKGAELSVEFHGRKESPPHRVLSESHLNSLGVALFLAMAETFNEQLGFIVLDDVVNSFDREHRGRLAELLVKEFGDSQLIVLTHDEQFFTHLCRRAPSWAQDQFTSWSYEDGPRTKRYEGDRLLQEAVEQLATGDRVGAAQKARRVLEEFLQEVCEGIEALLPFRRGQRNEQRMADEVMKGLRRALRDRAKPLYDELGSLLTAIEADLQAVLNFEAHAAQGGASKQEVSDALARITELRGRFTCENCGTPVWYQGTPDASRCKCGQTHFPPSPAPPSL